MSLHSHLLRIAFASIAVLFAYSSALSNIFFRWIAEEEYSHGFLIPLVTLALLWLRRDILSQAISRPSWSGFLLVLLASILLIIGELSAIFILMHLSFLCALFGLVLSYGGFRLGRVMFVPLFYLVFAVPAPYFLESQLTLHLQLLSSELGAWFLRALNISVFVEGNVIDLGHYQVHVVEACSGLRYLFPLFGVSFLAAYIFRAPLWQRAIVFLSALPITVLMNSFRIASVGVLVNRFGEGAAEGALHFLEGWVVFLICMVLLLLLMWSLARLNGEKEFRSVVLMPPVNLAIGSGTSSAQFSAPFLASIVSLVIIGILVQVVSDRIEHIPEREPFSSFPVTISGWQSRDERMESNIEQALGVDDYLLAAFTNEKYGVVNLYVAYYQTQRKGVSPHSPRVCVPGGGWDISQLTRETVATDDPDSAAIVVNRMMIAKGHQHQLVYYWFQQRGRSTANEYTMKWNLLWDALFRNRTDGALVRLMTWVSPSEESGKADERLRAFLSSLRPILPRYVPE